MTAEPNLTIQSFKKKKLFHGITSKSSSKMRVGSAHT